MQIADFLADKNRFDLWRYADFFDNVPSKFWVSDHRAELTALEQKSEKLWVKHEDWHPIGSHKGRSVAYQLSMLRSQGVEKVVLSSSGNAAIALTILNQYLKAFAFVSPIADSAKVSQLACLSKKYTQVITTPFPRNFAQYLVNKHQYVDLRPSHAQTAITGLRSLGFELAEQLPDLDESYSIFSVTTSGANILGMYEAFAILKEQKFLNSLPRLFPVLMTNYSGGTLTDERHDQLQSVVAATNGEIVFQAISNNGMFDTSFEGNTAFEAYEARKKSLDKVVVVFTGKRWPVVQTDHPLPRYATIQALKHDFLL